MVPFHRQTLYRCKSYNLNTDVVSNRRISSDDIAGPSRDLIALSSHRLHAFPVRRIFCRAIKKGRLVKKTVCFIVGFYATRINTNEKPRKKIDSESTGRGGPMSSRWPGRSGRPWTGTGTAANWIRNRARRLKKIRFLAKSERFSSSRTNAEIRRHVRRNCSL